MAKRKVGRPVSVWTPERLKKVNREMDEYTENTDIPILAEFAYTHDYQREELYKHVELTHAIKKMMTKKEAQLEKLGLLNVVNTAMAAFSLKQLGWRDKQEIEHSGEVAEKTKEYLDKMSNVSD